MAPDGARWILSGRGAPSTASNFSGFVKLDAIYYGCCRIYININDATSDATSDKSSYELVN